MFHVKPRIDSIQGRCYITWMYGIRHRTKGNAMVRLMVAPPCMLEWTDDVRKAQSFESRIVADATAEYITKLAFDVEVFDLAKELLFIQCNGS